ncbi:MAG: hypothetical protein ISS60_04970 [Desulfobacteraceae bacterium]|nr:hypothetical protein [Desulfobacteraceae bacterium]
MKRSSGLPINRDQGSGAPFLGLRTICYPATSLLAGLFAAQVIATLQVYLSNKVLYRTLTAINDAGYLAVPNQQIMNSLQEFGPALYGGLLFTLSVGAGLSLLSFAAAWAWDRLFSRNTIPLIFLLFLWAGSLAAANLKGFSPMVSAYFFVIPTVVFWVTLRLMPPQTKPGPWFYRIVPLIPIALLACLWGTQMDGHLFVDLRDKLLLSNPLGTRITGFYYRYTLYPAEVFKSLDHKTIKTCNLEQIKKRSLKRLLEGKLLNYDYLNTGGDGEVDLTIREEGKTLILENRGEVILRTTANDFLSAPANILKQFSSETDRYPFFRQFTFLSLLIGFPIALYIFLYTILLSLLSRFFDLRASSVAASILCVSAGILLLMPVLLGKTVMIDKKDLSQTLESGRWQERSAVDDLLKRIEESDKWYDQWRAYRALRALGWKQVRSKQAIKAD